MVISKLETTEVNDEVYVRNPTSLIPLLNEFYKNSEKEAFIAIALNGSNRVISIRTVSVGTVNKTLVHPREVFRYAIMENAAALIVSHNHPSGICNPSDNDVDTTKSLISASQIIGIELLDHIIISDSCYFSFMEHNLMGADNDTNKKS